MKTARVLAFVLSLSVLFADAMAQSTYIDEGHDAVGLSAGYGFFQTHNSSRKLSSFFGSFGISHAGRIEAGANAALVKYENKAEFITALQLGLYPVRFKSGPFTLMPGLNGMYQINEDMALWSVYGSLALDARTGQATSLQYGVMVGKYSSVDNDAINGIIRGGYISLAFRDSPSTTYLFAIQIQSDDETIGVSFNLSIITGTGINGRYK